MATAGVLCLRPDTKRPCRAERKDVNGHCLKLCQCALRHYHGRNPKPNRALRAFTAARLLREKALGIDTITKAASCTGVSRSLVKAALVIFRAENPNLVNHVLRRPASLFQAAKKVAAAPD